MQTIIDGVRCKKLYFRKNQGETERKTASGESIKITDGVRSNIYNVRVYGNTEQDGTTVAQLFDASILIQNTNDALTVSDDGYTIVASGGTSGAYRTSWCELELSELLGKTVYVMVDGITETTTETTGNLIALVITKADGNNLYASLNTTTSSKSLAVPSDATRARLLVYTNNTDTALSSVNTVTVKGLRVALTECEWEPYTGGQATPNPDYPCEIKSAVISEIKAHGKNLLKIKDGSTTSRGVTVTVENGIISLNGTCTETGYIHHFIDELTLNGTYTLTRSNDCPTCALLNSNWGGLINTGAVTAEVHATASIFAFVGKEGEVYDIKDIRVMLNEGTTALPLEPYTESSITLSEPIELNGIGEVRDGIVEKDGVFGVERNIASVSQNVFPKPTKTTEDGFWIMTGGFLNQSDIPKNTAINAYKYFMCDRLLFVPQNKETTSGDAVVSAYGHKDTVEVRPRFNANKYTADEAVTICKEATFYYVCNPSFEPLPTADQIALRSLMSYDGATYIECDSEVLPLMELEYDALISEAEYVLYKKAYVDGVLVYSAGNPVTYYVDTGKLYTEDVDFEASCLNPKTFTPTKEGWVFVGWREDTTASGSVLSSKVMGDTPVKLYAVFKQDITCKFYSYESTQYASGTRYYNGAGVTANASITVPNGTEFSGWGWRGWSASGQTSANASVGFANGAVINNVSAAFTLYGLYNKTLYLYYYVNGAKESESGTAYYNAAGSNAYPKVSVANPTLSGATFKGWSVTAGNAKVSYNSLARGLQITANTTVYAVFKYADPAMQEQSHQHDWDGEMEYDDSPRYITLTMPSTAGSMTVTAYGYGGSECIYVNGIELKEDGVWRTIGTYTANTNVKIVYGYAVNSTVKFRKTYVGKTIVG